MAKKLEKHQDYIYLQEDYYNKPKETFNFILNLIKKFHKKKNKFDFRFGMCSRRMALFCKKEN